MLALGRAMLADGKFGGRQILAPQTVGKALAPAKTPEGSSLPIGLGWHLGCTKNQLYAYHLGGGGGFRSELRIYPRLGYAVAVMANDTSFETGHFTRLLVR
jgi:D-alanyl-D-alanine carboxypeptidase